MYAKLVQSAKLPPITLSLAGGGTLSLPEAIPGRYVALLFYRGHWCPYCRRHLQRYQEHLDELEALGVTVVAATVDTLEQTTNLVTSLGLTFPVAFGVTDEDVAAFSPWFGDDDHGHYIQPMELLILRGGTLFGTMYASGPVGRMDPEEVLNSVRMRERRRLQQEQAASAVGG